MRPMNILIAGAGSIGMRHARNLRTLGLPDIALFEPDDAKRSAAQSEFACPVYGDYAEALTAENPSVVFVCSPTKFHVSQALAAAETGAHLFVEKPLNHTLQGVEALLKIVEERQRICMVGCNMRFHHGPSTIKKLLGAGAIGEPHDAEIHVLFDFTGRSDLKGNMERIRTTYNADPAQGGAIRECIHEIDLALWYLGPGSLRRATSKRADRIGIPEVEGEAHLYIDHEQGAASDVHVSFMHPEYQRGCVINGERGSLSWDFAENVVRVRDPRGSMADEYPAPEGYHVNQMYIDEVAYFFECVRNGTEPMGNLRDASLALDMALQALQTAEDMKENEAIAC